VKPSSYTDKKKERRERGGIGRNEVDGKYPQKRSNKLSTKGHRGDPLTTTDLARIVSGLNAIRRHDMSNDMPTHMLQVYSTGLKINAYNAREWHKEFEEIDISPDEASRSPYACPRCKGQQVVLYGTMQSCYQETWQEGKRTYHSVDKWKAEHLEIIECLTCKKRFFIRQDPPPLIQPRKRSKE
jgi:hypothetical protein